jgi:hypothetical protein
MRQHRKSGWGGRIRNILPSLEIIKKNVVREFQEAPIEAPWNSFTE